ncbi:MAG: hypothetical protein Fur006_59630 [Coleofasciculaceae cyanobacterium]
MKPKSQLQSCAFETIPKEANLDENCLRINRHQGKSIDFWQLWGQHQAYLAERCLSWMGGNSTDAREALSQATVKAWEKWQDCAGEIANFKAWVTRLTHNLCMDMHRKRAREARGIDRLGKIAVAESEHIASHVSSSESALLDRERDGYLRRAIDALPAQLRMPLILRYYQGMSYQDIAQELTLSSDSARKRVQKARTVLQQQLNSYFSELDDSSSLLDVPDLHAHRTPEGEARGTNDYCLDSTESPNPPTSPLPRNMKREHLSETSLESICYKVTALCLDVPSHTWYRSLSPLGWR